MHQHKAGNRFHRTREALETALAIGLGVLWVLYALATVLAKVTRDVTL